MRYYKVVLGDSRHMEETQNNTVDLIVTSPPYGSLDVFSKEGECGAEFDLSRYHELKAFFREISKTWAECERVLKPSGVLVCQWEDYTVGSRYYGYPREICLAGPMIESIEKNGLALIGRWIVKKYEHGLAMRKFNYALYSNLRNGGVPRAVANWSYAFAFYKYEYKPVHRKLDFTEKEWFEWSDGVWDINFLSAGTDISGGATYPIEFAERCIRLYTAPGDTILDPFLGSGTTMRAAYNLQRSCIGYEVLERMLPTIKSKVMYGTQNLFEPTSWEILNRYKEVKKVEQETMPIQADGAPKREGMPEGSQI